MGSIAIVPAAGKGERFGGAKLLASIHDKTVLENGSIPLWVLRENVERWIAATLAKK